MNVRKVHLCGVWNYVELSIVKVAQLLFSKGFKPFSKYITQHNSCSNSK